MHKIILNSVIIVFASLFAFALYAQDAADKSQNKDNTSVQNAQAKDDQSFAKFKETCVNAWMERASDSADKVAFKTFGEKYCQCALGKPMTNDEDIRKAARTCMAETLLHDTIDTLAGSADTTDKVEAGCQAKWTLIYPGMNDKMKQAANAYCQCSASKLVDIQKTKANLSDKEYNDKINDVAATCASKVEADKTTIKINNKINNKNANKI